MFSFKHYRQVQKSRFYVFVVKLGRKKRILEKNFLPTSRMEKKFVYFLSKPFRRGCGNLIVFSEHIFLKTSMVLFTVLRHWSTFCRLSGIFFGGVVKNAFYVSLENIWWEKKLGNFEFFHYSEFLNENSSRFFRIFFAWFVKTAFYVSIGNLNENFFCTKCLYLVILGHWANISALGWKSSGGVLETAFFVSKTTFWKKLFFFERNFVVFIIPGYWAKTFWQFDFFCQGCQNSILVARK